MSDYYSGLLNTLNDLATRHEWQQLSLLLNEELNMPYIPFDVQQQLIVIQQSIPWNEAVTVSVADDDQLEKWLNGSYDQQSQALQKLCASNVRQHLFLVINYLRNPKYLSIACILIDLLIEQNIDQPVEYGFNNTNVVFNPSQLQHPYQTAGFLDGINYLQQHYLQQPDKARVASDLWLKEAYFRLPGSIDNCEDLSMLEELVELTELMFSQAGAATVTPIDNSRLMIRMFEI